MANQNKSAEDKNTVENLNDQLTHAGRFVEEKKKVIFWGVGAVLVIAAFVIGYLFIFKAPRTNKSWEEYAKVELAAQGNDSVATAEYKKVADKYGSAGGGNLAAIQAGELLYNKGDYKGAIGYLEKADVAEPVLRASVTRLIGDCYVNLKNYPQALKYFEKAISQSDGNPQLVPAIMMKMANIYEAQNKVADALKVYEKIQAEYPEFKYGLGMDAYIARAKARLGK